MDRKRVPFKIRFQCGTVPEVERSIICEWAIIRTKAYLPFGQRNAPHNSLPKLTEHEIVILAFYPADWSPVCGDQMALYNEVLPEFRKLGVNEGRLQGGKSFGTHPHRDFEIISYIVSGALEHQDGMGTKAVMRAGDMQRISAGTGMAHSEYNHSPKEQVHFLQIWLVSSREGVRPDYTERSFGNPPPSGLTLACSSDGRDESIAINQDADLFIGRLSAGQEFTMTILAAPFDLNGAAIASAANR